jgi:hypothetical protein
MTKQGYEGQGAARAAITEFLNHCDTAGCRVFLTPVATESHVKKSLLNAFYKSLGFSKNKSRSPEFWSSSNYEEHYAMVREPKEPNKNLSSVAEENATSIELGISF